MKIINQNLVIILTVSLLLILILIRSTGMNHFKTDAKSHAEASVLQSNIINTEKFRLLDGNKLLINLDTDASSQSEISNEVINVTPDSILIKSHINSILKHAGPVIVYSSEPALSARIWMLLSQMGRENIFILTNSTDNETLKYKFQPDSLPNEQ